MTLFLLQKKGKKKGILNSHRILLYLIVLIATTNLKIDSDTWQSHKKVIGFAFQIVSVKTSDGDKKI